VQNAPEAGVRRDWFPALAVAYLAVPAVIFFAGWIRPAVGIPAALVVVGTVIFLVRQKNLAVPRPVLPVKTFCAVLVLALLWTLLIGVGGVFPQSSDYVKHNLLFHDLASLPWPVNYDVAGGKNYLCYGTGYYLVPALGGKLLGFGAVPVLAFLWTLAGVALFFYWLASRSKSPATTLTVVLLFAAPGILWTYFKLHGLPGLVSADGLQAKLLKNGLFFNYNDSFTRFQFQPQHALTGWLGAAVLYEMLWTQKNPRGVVFVWAACLLWSPLTGLGLLLVPLAAWRQVRWQNYFEPANLLGGGVLLAVLGIYFQGHRALADNGFIWEFSSGADWLLFYPLFLVLTVSPVLFMALVELKYKILGETRPLFFGAAAILLLLPLYKMGFAGDLRMQSAAPALLLLALAADRILQHEKLSLEQPLCQLLVAGLLLGAVYPALRPCQSLLSRSYDRSYASVVQGAGWRTLPDMRDPGFDVTIQYLGRPDSLAARWLLR
jgi:hypothetical protein